MANIMSSVTDNGGTFASRAGASDSSSTLLVQAVPHASRLRQMPVNKGPSALRAFTPAAHCCLRPHAHLAHQNEPERCG